jgi:threonine dehydratase
LDASRRWAETSRTLEIHAYDSVETLLGQGTVGVELDRQTHVDTLMVAVGGGGLIGGIAAYCEERAAKGSIKIIGVEPESAPTLTNALKAGLPVDSPAGGVAADSLAPRRVGEVMFPIAQRCVDHVVLVSDDAICRAQTALWDQLCIVAEPGGAAAFAAQAEARNVKMVKASWNDCFTDELETFPLGVHDDQVDAASDAFNALLGPRRAAVLDW